MAQTRVAFARRVPATPTPPVDTPDIESVVFGTPFQYNLNNYEAGRTVVGDGWSVTWANDDVQYVNVCDTSGFDGLVYGGANTMFGKISAGPNPGATDWNNGLVIDNWPSPTTTLNDKGWGRFNTCTAPGYSSHKIGGVVSVHGTLYAHGWRLRCSGSPDNPVGGGTNQWQLIKSVDNARTWTPTPPANATGFGYYGDGPMFDGGITPMGFIQYGKDYEDAGLASEGKAGDNSDKYVYAMVIDNYPSLISRRDQWLARCLITKIGDLDADDWEFYKGGDGMLDSSWGTREEARTDTATGQPGTLVHIDTPGVVGQLFIYYWNVNWLPYWRQYLTFNVSRATGGGNLTTTWTPYVARHPWGPWRAVAAANNVFNNAAGALAFANTVPKSIAVDGGRNITVFGSGSDLLPNAMNVQTGPYTLFIIPATVS